MVSLRYPQPILFLKLSVLGLLLAGLATPSKAQDKVELFGGYSYLRASVRVRQFGPLGPGTPCPPNCGNPPAIAQHANLNGWEFSGQYKLLPFLGAVADFNGSYGTLDGARTHVHTFLIGPQVSFPAKFLLLLTSWSEAPENRKLRRQILRFLALAAALRSLPQQERAST
jgi:hypothetical protein